MHCQCLNGLEFLHFSSPVAAMFVENKFNPNALVTWLITLRLIICPSSYQARPDNLIGLIKFLIRHNFSPTEQCQTKLPDLKFCGRSSSDIQTTILHYCMYKSNNIHKCLFGPVTTFQSI